jgi:rhodanese-related sulfurtransferase
LGKAFAEARYVALGAILMAVAFNVFAESRVPWIRRLPGTGDTVSLGQLLADTAATPIDTATAAADTTAVVDTTSAVDTAASADDSLRAVRDSLRAAKAAVRDSLAKIAAAQGDAVEISSKEINTTTAKQIFDRKVAVWFDARTADEFGEGHIPGAHNVYAGDPFQEHIPEVLGLNLKKDQLIVVYCGGGLCELSHELARNIQLLGFTKVVVYTGGTTDWTKNNYPMTKGE